MAQDNWGNDTNETECQKHDGPVRCTNGCGFFGSAGTNNLCSKCYRDLVLNPQLKVATQEKSSTVQFSETVELIKTEVDNLGKATLENVEEQINGKSANSYEAMVQDNGKNESQKHDSPVPCANNCGFFGSTATNNLCSKCYRSLVLERHLGFGSLSPIAESSESMVSSCMPVEPVKEEEDNSSKASMDIVIESQSEEQPNKKPANRCELCRKKVGLTGFKCRCGGMYCSTHRYSDAHECTFDYKSLGKEAIAKANPVIKAEKIDKI